VCLRNQYSRQSPFQFQQLSFHIQPSAVAAEFSIGRDHAMTGNHNCYGIAIVGYAYGAECVRLAYCTSDVRIASSFSKRNRPQSLPTGDLEVRTAKIEREGELAALAAKIFLKFAHVTSHRRS
jgi:hypothetical protein